MCKNAEEIAKRDFKGYAEKRLQKLDQSVLDSAAKLVGLVPDKDKSNTIRMILEYKRRVVPDKKHGLLEETRQVAKCAQQYPSLLNMSIFKPRNTISICFFNALKLRTGKEELLTEWNQLILAFASFDAVVMSEIPATDSTYEKRVQDVLERLNETGDWSATKSEESGPGNPEVHVAFVKKPFRVDRVLTLHDIQGTEMHHAPAVFSMHNEYTNNTVMVSSVHFPPESKRSLRDTQIKKFVAFYPELMRAEGIPFTDQGAMEIKKNPVFHIVGGDFNVWVGDEMYRTRQNGFDVLLGSGIPTTSGNRAFDNILISRDTRNNFTISSRVLLFQRHQNSFKGIIGLSDHSPILLKLES
jgi:hypothetical protein